MNVSKNLPVYCQTVHHNHCLYSWIMFILRYFIINFPPYECFKESASVCCQTDHHNHCLYSWIMFILRYFIINFPPYECFKETASVCCQTVHHNHVYIYCIRIYVSILSGGNFSCLFVSTAQNMRKFNICHKLAIMPSFFF